MARDNVTPIQPVATNWTKAPVPKSVNVQKFASDCHDRVLQVKYILKALYQAVGPEGEEGPMAQYVLEGVEVLLEDAEDSLDQIEEIGSAALRARLLKPRASEAPEVQS